MHDDLGAASNGLTCIGFKDRNWRNSFGILEGRFCGNSELLGTVTKEVVRYFGSCGNENQKVICLKLLQVWEGVKVNWKMT